MDITKMRVSIIFITIILVFCGIIQNAESFRDSGSGNDVINCDLCYLWRTKKFPFWASPLYKVELIKQSKYFLNTEYSDERINDLCKVCPKNLLDPENNDVDYEICYYAKFGLWSKSHSERKTKRLEELLKKYVLLGGGRVKQEDVKLLCPNYDEMECPLWKKEIEKNCYYAAHGFWKDNERPADNYYPKKFFYIGECSIDWREIWNKCETYFEGKHFQSGSVHYPPCPHITHKTSTSAITPPPETPPPETPPPETPPPETPPPETPPPETCPPETPPPETPPPETPPPETPPPETCPPETPPPETPPPVTPPPETPPPETCSPETPPPETPPPETTPPATTTTPLILCSHTGGFTTTTTPDTTTNTPTTPTTTTILECVHTNTPTTPTTTTILETTPTTPTTTTILECTDSPTNTPTTPTTTTIQETTHSPTSTPTTPSTTPLVLCGHNGGFHGHWRR